MKTLIPILSLSGLLAATLSAQTFNLNPTDDTYVRSDGASNPRGHETSMLIGNHSSVGPFNALFKFDLSDPSLVGKTVQSATLRLTSIDNAGVGTALNIDLFQLSAANADWVEGDGSSANFEDWTGATFREKETDNTTPLPWASSPSQPGYNAGDVTTWAGHNAFTAGTDYVNTVLGNYSGVTNTATGGQTFDFGNAAFATIVESAIGGNLDLVLIGNTPGVLNFLRIATKENASFAAPELIINAIPEPGSFALLGGFLALGAVTLRRRRA